MEYRLSQNFMKGTDFYEGVRAALVDKDKNPRWNPSSILQVTQQTVDAFFAPLPPNEELHLKGGSSL